MSWAVCLPRQTVQDAPGRVGRGREEGISRRGRRTPLWARRRPSNDGQLGNVLVLAYRVQPSWLDAVEPLDHLPAAPPLQSPGLLDNGTDRSEGVLGPKGRISERVGDDIRRKAGTPCTPPLVTLVRQANWSTPGSASVQSDRRAQHTADPSGHNVSMWSPPVALRQRDPHPEVD
jgi:hypothetical protein